MHTCVCVCMSVRACACVYAHAREQACEMSVRERASCAMQIRLRTFVMLHVHCFETHMYYGGIHRIRKAFTIIIIIILIIIILIIIVYLNLRRGPRKVKSVGHEPSQELGAAVYLRPQQK